MDIATLLVEDLKITPDVVREATRGYCRQAIAAYASQALAIADDIDSAPVSPISPAAPAAPVVPVVPVAPVVPAAQVARMVPDGTGQQPQGPRAATASSPRRQLPEERPAVEVRGFRPINNPAPVAAQHRRPQNQNERPKEQVLCACSSCKRRGGQRGQLVSKSTKHEHEHADQINKGGESVDEDGKCSRCKKNRLRCVRPSKSKVCGECTRVKEKCSWNGESERKREVEKRERAARRIQQRQQRRQQQQPSPDQREQSAEKQSSGDGEKTRRSTTPSPRSSRSQTVDDTSDSARTRKRQRTKSQS
ncbi:hypothetical protein LZ32DRAFT_690819 [Colletotrichum eremochloae]|nr:hypothetical protein LZ32DRAFT_690819 [Colletotrichum eremochloae]